MYIALQTFVHGRTKIRKGVKFGAGVVNPGYIKELIKKGLIITEADVKKAEADAAKVEAETEEKKAAEAKVKAEVEAKKKAEAETKAKAGK